MGGGGGGGNTFKSKGFQKNTVNSNNLFNKKLHNTTEHLTLSDFASHLEAWKNKN